MSKEEIFEHYNWTFEHEEKLKSYFEKLNETAKEGLINQKFYDERISFIKEQMVTIYEMRKELLAEM